MEIGISRAKRIYRLPGMERQIVFYGTSITQGASASRPGMAATAIIGRELQSEIINLGFSGNGFMEIEMADLLSELNPAVYVLDCLPNMSPQQVSERVAPFVQRLRQSRPTTPILLVEDPDFRDQTTPKGVILRQVFTKLKEQGDTHLYLLPNKGMLGTDGDGTVDGIHPNDLGMARQAAVFTARLKSILEEQTVPP